MANETKNMIRGEVIFSPRKLQVCEKSAELGTKRKKERVKYCGEGDDKEGGGERLEGRNNMPAAGPAPIPLASVLLPGEHRDIRIDVQEFLTNSDEWLATPNTNYHGRRPVDLIGTPDEQLLRDTLRSAMYSGMA